MKKQIVKTRKKNKKMSKKILMSGVLLSILSSTTTSTFSSFFNTPISVSAEIGDNVGGNSKGFTWGGKYYSWLLTVAGKPAFCINLGLEATTGQEMTRRITEFQKNPMFVRFISAGHGRNIMNLQQKHGLTDEEAWKGTIYVAHVIENILGYGPQKDKLTENEFRELATSEGKVGEYAIELLEFAKNGKIPQAQVSILEPENKLAKYNASTKRLETGIYTVNDVESFDITIKGLPADVYMVDSVTNKKVDKLVKSQKFKLVTENLSYTAQINNILANAGVREHSAIIWQFEGVQDLIQYESTDPLDSVPFSAEFKSVLGKIEFQKMNITKNKPLIGIPFELIDEKGNIVQTVKSTEGGKVIFDKVLEGKYTVKEVPIKGDGLIDEVITVDATVTGGKTTTLKTIENKENQIEFSKLDNENNKVVKDAKVELINKEGKVVWSGDGNSKITGIPAGEYVLKETLAPTRYLMNPETTKVTITENGKVSVGVIHDETRDIRVVKKDGVTGKPLKGAEFKLVKLDDTEMEMLNDKNELVPAVAISDDNGVVRFRGMPIGDYKVVEVKAPNGYTINSDLSVKAEKDNDSQYDFIDYEIPKTPEKPSIPSVPIFDSLPKTGNKILDVSFVFVGVACSSFVIFISGFYLGNKKREKNDLEGKMKAGLIENNNDDIII